MGPNRKIDQVQEKCRAIMFILKTPNFGLKGPISAYTNTQLQGLISV